MEDKKLLNIIFSKKYQGMTISLLWKNLVDADKEIDLYFSKNSYSDFYDSLDESLFISEKIRKKPFKEREKLMTSLMFWKGYELVFGNDTLAESLSEQITYLQKLAY
ncbi:MAG: hypothetical protein V1886_00465 [archaeon]